MLDSVIGFFRNFTNPGFLINVAGVVLQYVVLLILYLFLYRIARNIFSGLRTPAVSGMNRGQLCIIAGNGAEEFGIAAQTVYELGKNTSIGRNETNNIVINSTVVSSEHAFIVRQSGRYYIDDCGSTNGTSLNGRLVAERTELKVGDEVAIGPVSFTVQEG